MDAGRQVAQVPYLLSREPGGAQVRFLDGDELGRRRRIVTEEADEASIDRARRLGGELLPHDSAHEGAVALVAASAASRIVVERAEALYKGGHDRIAAPEKEAKARVLGGVRGLPGSS
jgi:hypothetical protein